MNTYRPLAALLLLLALTACHREAPIVSTPGKPKYEIVDGASYVDHTIYDLYKRTGLEVIYRFDPEDALWDLGSSTGTLTRPRYTAIDPADPADMAMVEDNLRHVVDHFVARYSDDFIRKYFPLRFFLADTITKTKGANNLLAASLRDHIAVNMYREGEVVKLPGRTLSTRKEVMGEMPSQLHATLWAFIFAHRISAPEAFTAYSADYYGQNLDKILKKPGTSEEDLDHRDRVLRSHGFWSYDELNSFSYYRALKDPALDIADYIYRMTTLSEEQIRSEIAGYEIMVEKYEALRRFILDNTGTDLQEIGNAVAAEREGA